MKTRLLSSLAPALANFRENPSRYAASNIARTVAILTPAIWGLALTTALAQTTNTNCTQNGNQVNCTSTTDNSAEQNAEASRRAGEQMGAAIGVMIARHNQVKNYCKYHPGEQWHSEDWTRAGTCGYQKTAKVKTGAIPTSHFAPNSPEANKWCVHQPKRSSYIGSDGGVYDCPERTSVASVATVVHVDRPAVSTPVTHVDPATASTIKWAGEWHVVGNQLQCVYRYSKTDGTPVIFTQLYDVGQPPGTITSEQASAHCPL